jgi:hypothetical protein
MTFFAGDIPGGAYDSGGLANIGLGHAAIEVGGADLLSTTISKT